MLLLATILIVAIGFAHSFLGERYILIRSFRQRRRARWCELFPDRVA